MYKIINKMYITLNTMIYAFKVGTYIHTAHTVWGIYNFGKKSFTGCKTICENSYYYVVSK